MKFDSNGSVVTYSVDRKRSAEAMNELLAFLLPPATALVGMRIARLLLGKKLDEEFTFGLRFALGMCVGMFVFTQSILSGSVVGLNWCAFLAWTVLAWALVEAIALVLKVLASLKPIHFRLSHLWLLMLIPVVLLLGAYGRLNLVDGIHEFDAGAFWILKARISLFRSREGFSERAPHFQFGAHSHGLPLAGAWFVHLDLRRSEWCG